jgi:hypothetical protein
MMKASVKEDQNLSHLRNGALTARSTPQMRSLTILTNQSHPVENNESHSRLKLLENSMRDVEPVSHGQVSQYIPSSFANRSDEPMSDSEEEGNSTRKFIG